MKTIATNIVRLLTLQSLTGPIFSKELRVASRRKRFYLMRGLYLAALMILMSLVWVVVTDTLNSPGYRSSSYAVSRMAEASKIIINSIAWFQFIAAQLIAVVMCSTAINSEIHNRTLYVLMTTPITAFQLVIGKLASRLWQIVLLMAVSLPLLAMVRVFGGIPWSFLIDTFCVTVSTVFFISVVTIFFSIFFRRAYVVIIFTVIAQAVLFGVLPFMVTLFLISRVSFFSIDFEEIFSCLNPYVYMVMQSYELFHSSSGLASGYAIVLCLLQFILGLFILWAACGCVRKAALKQMTPKSGRKKYKIPLRKSKTYWLRRPIFLHSFVQKTIGTGMIWKEFLHPVLGRFRKLVFGALIALLMAAVVSVFVTVSTGSLAMIGVVAIGSVMTLAALAILMTIIIPATCLTVEKEAGSWPILLTTCYGDWQIIGGKIIGISRRILLVWLPFVVIFYCMSAFFDNPLWLLIKLMVAASIGVGFVISSGVYFSSRLRHSTVAVVCNLILAGLLWAGLPFLVSLYREIAYSYDWLPRWYFSWWNVFGMTPPGMILHLMDDGRGVDIWAWGMYAGLHLVMIGLFLWRTKANLRKRIC